MYTRPKYLINGVKKTTNFISVLEYLIIRNRYEAAGLIEDYLLN